MNKSPEQCQDINDIRSEIDRIDEKIIQLISQRAGFVKAAAPFKSSKSSVKAEDRVKTMLGKRRQWAIQEKMDPDFVENLFMKIIQYFINEEIQHWEKS